MVCDGSGVWTNKPTCDANSCNAGQTISNSVSVDPNPTSQSTGYSWTVTCNVGYTVLAATGSMVCDGTGSWNNKPTCDANSCGWGQTISNAASVDPNPSIIPLVSGLSWTVSCNPGYTVSAGTGNIVCDGGGLWSNKPTCNANSCNAGQTIVNSASVNPNPTSQSTGYSWTVSCNSGFTVSAGTGSMVCDAGGSWTNIPTCNAKSCNAGQIISNSASVDPDPTSESTGYSWVVSCSSGYTVSAGTGSMVCDGTGKWSNIPMCNGMQVV